METLAFWLPLILLFASALLGTALRRSFKDHCLKKFEDCKIVMPVQGATWEIGVLQVFAQGIELFYKEPRSSVIGKLNSYVLHPSEVDQIPFFYVRHRRRILEKVTNGTSNWKEFETQIS